MTQKEAFERSKSERYVFPDIIDSTSGLYEVPELNVVGIPTWNRLNKNNKRKAVLEITSFKGISSNAIHFYGKIVVDGVYQATLGNIEVPKNLSFDEQREHPLLNYKYEFIVKRPLTKIELEKSPDRWECYFEGDLVKGYETTAELINDAKEIFKLRFTGDWNFIVQYPNGKKINV